MNGDPGRVLLLEHDPSLREMLEAALGDEGYRVEPCASLAAVAAGAGGGDAVAVADCWAGWRRAFTAADRRQLAAANARAPLVLLPNQAWAAAMAAEDLGVAAVLPKPFDLAMLLGTVARLRRP
jgi:DNA-binding response OmpR family regulator